MQLNRNFRYAAIQQFTCDMRSVNTMWYLKCLYADTQGFSAACCQEAGQFCSTTIHCGCIATQTVKNVTPSHPCCIAFCAADVTICINSQCRSLQNFRECCSVMLILSWP